MTEPTGYSPVFLMDAMGVGHEEMRVNAPDKTMDIAGLKSQDDIKKFSRNGTTQDIQNDGGTAVPLIFYEPPRYPFQRIRVGGTTRIPQLIKPMTEEKAPQIFTIQRCAQCGIKQTSMEAQKIKFVLSMLDSVVVTDFQNKVHIIVGDDGVFQIQLQDDGSYAVKRTGNLHNHFTYG